MYAVLTVRQNIYSLIVQAEDADEALGGRHEGPVARQYVRVELQVVGHVGPAPQLIAPGLEQRQRQVSAVLRRARASILRPADLGSRHLRRLRRRLFPLMGSSRSRAEAGVAVGAGASPGSSHLRPRAGLVPTRALITRPEAAADAARPAQARPLTVDDGGRVLAAAGADAGSRARWAGIAVRVVLGTWTRLCRELCRMLLLLVISEEGCQWIFWPPMECLGKTRHCLEGQEESILDKTTDRWKSAKKTTHILCSFLGSQGKVFMWFGTLGYIKTLHTFCVVLPSNIFPQNHIGHRISNSIRHRLPFT